jgi:hypothetical protein
MPPQLLEIHVIHRPAATPAQARQDREQTAFHPATAGRAASANPSSQAGAKLVASFTQHPRGDSESGKLTHLPMPR